MEDHNHLDTAFKQANSENITSDAGQANSKTAAANPTVSALKNREIFLHGPVTRDSAHSIIIQMRALASLGKEPITFWINSNGGSVYDGLAVFDTMRDLMSQGITVKTKAYGMAASMGSFLLSAGSPGHRTMLPNARDMTHQPSKPLKGANDDELQNHAKSLSETREILESHYAHFMGLDYKNKETRKLIKQHMTDDVYKNPYMAIRMGLIDKIELQDNGSPQSGLTDEFLRKSIEIDIHLNKLHFDNIDTSEHSVDPRRHIKKLIQHRDEYLASQSAANSNIAPSDPPATSTDTEAWPNNSDGAENDHSSPDDSNNVVSALWGPGLPQ